MGGLLPVASNTTNGLQSKYDKVYRTSGETMQTGLYRIHAPLSFFLFVNHVNFDYFAYVYSHHDTGEMYNVKLTKISSYNTSNEIKLYKDNHHLYANFKSSGGVQLNIIPISQTDMYRNPVEISLEKVDIDVSTLTEL